MRMLTRSLAALAACLVASCSSVGDGDSNVESPALESSAPETNVESSEAYSGITPSPAPALVQPVQDQTQELIRQKRELIVETALENARAFRERGDHVNARKQLEQALMADPTNAEASVEYMEVLELLGERVGQLRTVREAIEARL